MKIALLHTLSSNQALFTPYTESLQRQRPDVTRSHHVNEDLLHNARKIESKDDEARVTNEVHQAVSSIVASGKVDFVVCTCSTIGDMAETFSSSNGVPVVLRVDRPMAECAVQYPTIHVLAALESTLEPTQKLLQECASQSNTMPSIHRTVVPGAWSHFQRGDPKAYAQSIADYIVDKHSTPVAKEKEEVIVLAQASMSPAQDLVELTRLQKQQKQLPRILTSPSLCMEYLAGLQSSNK